MSQDINENLLNVSSHFYYRSRPVARVECEGFQRGTCNQAVGCVAIVDVSRSTHDQIIDLRIGLCDTAVQIGAAAALAHIDVPPLATAGQ